MKAKLPSKKDLNRKIVVDDIGTYYVVKALSKKDLQILIGVIYDDLQSVKAVLREKNDELREIKHPSTWGYDG